MRLLTKKQISNLWEASKIALEVERKRIDATSPTGRANVSTYKNDPAFCAAMTETNRMYALARKAGLAEL
jgi:hypothetical protein